jgi:phosphatidylinositol phospholipase C gamma-1
MKWSDDAQNIKPGRCFVVFHGTDFNLKTLSVVALSEQERELWVRGLNFLVEDIRTASYRYICMAKDLLACRNLVSE